MKKVKVKVPAKVNLTLDVVGVKDGYHQLKSLFASVGLYDYITVKKRKDNNIVLKEKGIKSGVSAENNNAYKTAQKFIKEANVSGVNITIKKNIPVGGGLGGSSADVVGTLIAMQKLFNTNVDLVEIANQMGSDTAYMLQGGYAFVEGRGEKITSLKNLQPINLLLLCSNGEVSAKESYQGFDKLNKCIEPCTEKAINFLKQNDYLGFCKTIKNDLYLSSKELCADIDKNLSILKTTDADAVIMSGSGATVFGIYKDKKSLNIAYRKLKKTCKKLVIKTSTII